MTYTILDEKKTHHNLSWALWGSTFYEIVLTGHRIAIFSLLPKESYGFLVTLLAIIHLGTHIGDFGAANSIPPLLHHFTRSKRHFIIMLWRYTVLPHMPLLFMTTGAVLLYTSSTCQTLGWGKIPWTVGFLIIVETIEAFMRQFLYYIQYVRQTVIIETVELVARLGIIWTLFFCFSYPITHKLILYSHLIEAGSICVFFIFLLRKFYASLPDLKPDLKPNNNHTNNTLEITDFTRNTSLDPLNLTNKINACDRHFVQQKIPNYLLRLSRNIFTTSFLTPLFAVQYGLSSAGVFYFASKLSKAVLAAVKITIGYTGTGLLAQAKHASQEIKQSIFSVLSRKLTLITLPILMLFIPAATLYTSWWQKDTVSITIVSLSFLFLVLSVTECFFILYESYFIVEEASVHLFSTKIGELGILWIIIHSPVNNNPQTMLISIIILRVTTLLYIAYTAYKNWRIAPTFECNRWFVKQLTAIIIVLGMLCHW